jgi:hypothetical protein
VFGGEFNKSGPLWVKEGLNDQCLCISLFRCRKGAFKLVGTINQHCLKVQTEPCCRQAKVLYIRTTERVCDRVRRENGYPRKVWNKVAEEL